ncbi:hypothetical protein CTI14_01365 [Methylobacterium radiotolerans]|nr:hypothetical protein CTI14_01365 [Methylobacterium radiotolerans]
MGAVIGLIAGLVIESDALQSSLLGLGETFKPLGAVLQELGTTVGPVVADLLARLGDQLAEVVPLLADVLVDAISQLAPPLVELLVALLPLLPPLIELAVDILPILTQALQMLIPVLVPLIQGLAELTAFVVNLLLFLNGNTTMDEWGRQIEGTQGPIIDMARGINDWLAPALNFLMGLVSQVASTWNAAWSRVTAFFSSAATNISGTATRIWSTLTSVFSSGVSRVVSIFTGLPRHIQNLFAGAGSWLVSSGRALLQGFDRRYPFDDRQCRGCDRWCVELGAGVLPAFAGSSWPVLWSGLGCRVRWWPVVDGAVRVWCGVVPSGVVVLESCRVDGCCDCCCAADAVRARDS